MYFVGLCCIIWECSLSPHALFYPTTAKAIIVVSAVLFFLEETFLFGLLDIYMQTQVKQFYFLVAGAISALTSSILCFTLAGNLSTNFSRELFLSALSVANMIPSSNQTVPMYPEFMLALVGTLLKGLSWIFIMILFLAMAKTSIFPHQGTSLRMNQNKISNFYVSIRMVIFIIALYISAEMWSMMVSSMLPDFTHSIYTMYLFFPYLISLSISEYLEDNRLTRGVILSIISVFVAMLFKNMLDLAGTIYHCSSHWSLQCIERNPVYYSTIISNCIAGILLWLCISELWPLSDDKNPSTQNSRDKHSCLSYKVVTL
jgi:hypothetical protein